MRRNVNYKPPFPWFGGKSPVADVVWSALGNVKNYVEPFFGSGAVLFLRPGGPGPIETINDADGYVANFWRAIQRDSDAVAEHADWPVNECDMTARHLWLLEKKESLVVRLFGDAEFYDVKAAGWWVYGQCCWIGSGWCSGRGPWIAENGELRLRNTGQGVNRQRPHLGDTGQGVNRQLPHLGDTGQGGESATPALGRHGAGRQPETPGVWRQRPVIEPEKRGVVASAQETPRSGWLKDYLGEFSDRLRNVRVCCGDWSRVCGPSVTFRHGLTGVFLDPPYADSADRTDHLYSTDCQSVAHDVRRWAIEMGERDDMRIVLAGYEGEHEMPETWRVHEWAATGGYALIGDDDEAGGRANRGRERLWFSPACADVSEPTLFDMKL